MPTRGAVPTVVPPGAATAVAGRGRTKMTIDLKGEAHDTAVQVADGFWVIATEHHPGGAKVMPEINNRALVFRLEEAGAPVLLLSNGVAESAIPVVQGIEKETGLTVKYVLSPGGGHHFLMPPWHDAFPEAQILVPPTRVPRTAGGKKLLAMERASVMDLANPLPQFAGQLDAVIFDGLIAAKDRPMPAEGGPDGLRLMLTMMATMMFGMKDPTDELWLFHHASGTLIGGENLGWMYPADVLAKQPGMLKSMVTPDALYVFKDVRKVGDAAKVKGHWEKILTWPAKNAMTYHDVPGHSFSGDVQGTLRASAQAAGQL